MAISRREMLKRGVSYGTGAINFGNDSIAYERELRKLASDSTFETFLSTLAETEERMAAQANEEETKATNDAAGLQEQSQKSPLAQADYCDEMGGGGQEQPQENPLAQAVEAAKEFRELCSRLALSDLYMQMSAIISTMEETCLPAVDELANVKSEYAAILEYLQRC